jgi:hypothetical protein
MCFPVLFQTDESKWPELQQCQFQAVREHAAFVDACLDPSLSQCIHDGAEASQHLYSAPLWIDNWEALMAMSEAKRIIMSFHEQHLSRLVFPWMHV